MKEAGDKIISCAGWNQARPTAATESKWRASRDFQARSSSAPGKSSGCTNARKTDAVEQLSPRMESRPVQIRLFEPGADEVRQKIRGFENRRDAAGRGFAFSRRSCSGNWDKIAGKKKRNRVKRRSPAPFRCRTALYSDHMLTSRRDLPEMDRSATHPEHHRV